MKKEYSKPELNIAEYIIEETITASSTFGKTWDAENDATATWEDFK